MTIEAPSHYTSRLAVVPAASAGKDQARRPSAEPSWPAVDDTFDATRRPTYEAAKRVFDLVIAIPISVLLLPLAGLIAALIKLDSRGPVFVSQERIGLRLKPFDLLQFRTTHLDESQTDRIGRGEHKRALRLVPNRPQPRLTRAGRLLGWTGLESLPQLHNVLSGDLSLVGPRAPFAWELEGFKVEQTLRLAVVPGITGLWRVSGHSRLPFGEVLGFDLEYIERRGVLLDLTLLVKSIPALIFGG